MYSFGKRLLSALKFGFGTLLLIMSIIVGTIVFCFSNLKMIIGSLLIFAFFVGWLPLLALIIGIVFWVLVCLNLLLGLPVTMNNGEWILN